MADSSKPSLPRTITGRLRDGGRFVLRPVPREDHSWHGALMELASDNGFEGIGALASLYGMSPSQLAQIDAQCGWDAILAGNPIEVPMVARASGNRRSTYSRVCCQCLATDAKPYVRAEWDLPLCVVCRVHKTLLLDQCAGCGRPIDNLRTAVTQCQCGRRFVSAPLAVPTWIGPMLAFFMDADDPARRARFAWACADEIQAARVLVRIADHQSGQSPIYLSKRRVEAPMLRQAHLMHLKPWFEGGADSFLGKMIELGGAEEVWMRYRLNLKLYRFPALSRILTEASMTVPLDVRRLVRTGEDPARMFYRISDLRKIFRIDWNVVIHWVERGFIPSAAIAPGRRSRISASAFDVIKRMYDDSCTVEQAAELVGCSAATVRKLARLGAIREMGLYRQADRLDSKSLLELSVQLLSSVQSAMPSDRVGFELVVGRISSRDEWRALCSLACKGGVYWGRMKKARVANLWFSRAELASRGLRMRI